MLIEHKRLLLEALDGAAPLVTIDLVDPQPVVAPLVVILEEGQRRDRLIQVALVAPRGERRELSISFIFINPLELRA